MKVESIALSKINHESEVFVTEIPVAVDGVAKSFLLDTGAATSSLALDEQTTKFMSLGIEESRGASGKVKICHIVQPDKITFGSYTFHKTF